MIPPPNYVPVPSAVDGIDLFAPAPEQPEAHREVVAFNCPQCGATTAYSVENGGLTCSHCGFHEPPAKEIVGKGAEEFEFRLETMERAAHGWGEKRTEMVCQNCGVKTTIPVDALSHTCAFCDSNKVIQREAPQDDLRPRFLIPFQVKPDQCHPISQEWIGNHWMVPKQLRDRKFNAFTALYLPFWTFDARTAAAWRAEVGHERQQSYYDSASKSWKTRTVIDWHWESGNASRTFDDLLESATDRLRPDILAEIRQFRLSDLTVFDPSYLAGMQAKGYDVSLDEGWRRARERMRESTRETCREQASTSRIRNFSMKLDFQDESWRYVLLPVYINSFKFKDKTYQVMINGQTGVISGHRPVDWTKLIWVILAVFSPSVLMALLAVVTFIFGGGVVFGGLAFVLFLVALGVSIYLVIDAFKVEGRS